MLKFKTFISKFFLIFLNNIKRIFFFIRKILIKLSKMNNQQ